MIIAQVKCTTFATCHAQLLHLFAMFKPDRTEVKADALAKFKKCKWQAGTALRTVITSSSTFDAIFSTFSEIITGFAIILWA